MVRLSTGHRIILAICERSNQPGGLAAVAEPQNAAAFGLDDVLIVQLC
jgi:hypothetical protein